MSVQGIASKTLAEPIQLGFKYLRKSSSFKPLIQECLGRSNFAKCIERKDRKCEVLLINDEEPLGLFVYKRSLNNDLELAPQSFSIKTFQLINPKKNLGKTYEQILLDRVIKFAKRSFAQGVIVEIEKQSLLLPFLQSKGFNIIKSWDEEYDKHLVHFSLPSKKTRMISTAEKTLETVNKSNSEEKISKKRTRTQEDQPVDSRKQASKRKRESDFEVDSVKRKREEYKDQESREKRAEERAPRIEMPRRVVEPSFRPPPPRVHNLPMKGTIYFDYIMSGKKKYEGRVCGYACNSMRVGDHLKLFDRRAGWGIICEITSKDQYRGFEEMLRDKGVLPMLPQLEDASRRLSDEGLLREGVKIYQAFPGSQRVHRAGSIAIGVNFIKKIYR
jgi:ASC-1-like (ASCH) protein